MLCRDPANRITIDEIKCHVWFPTEGYTLLRQASESDMRVGHDGEIISMMEANGIDCSEIVHSIVARRTMTQKSYITFMNVRSKAQG
jgi:hypothetical protein